LPAEPTVPPAPVPAGAADPKEPADPAGPGVQAGRNEPVAPDPGANDRVLLEGPHSRLREVQILLRAMRDFVRGFAACISSVRASPFLGRRASRKGSGTTTPREKSGVA